MPWISGENDITIFVIYSLEFKDQISCVGAIAGAIIFRSMCINSDPHQNSEFLSGWFCAKRQQAIPTAIKNQIKISQKALLKKYAICTPMNAAKNPSITACRNGSDVRAIEILSFHRNTN